MYWSNWYNNRRKKMKHFVYYDDDYPDNGGVGFKEFESKRKVIEFIEKRIGESPMTRSIDNYIVIVGAIKKIEAVETVLHVKIT